MRTREPILTRGRDHWDRVNLPVSEFEARVGRVREAMTDESLGALVIYGIGDRDGDIAYLSNLVHKVPGFPLALVVTAETVIVLNQRSSRTRPIVERSTWVDDVRFTRDLWDTLEAVLADEAPDGPAVGLVGGDAMAADDHDALDGLREGRSIVAADRLLETARATKSPRELDQLRRSGRLLESVVGYLDSDLRAPVNERRLEAKLDRFARLHGAQDVRVLVSNPGRTEDALRPAEDLRITEDDPVSVYLAVRFEGYWTAVARMTGLGGSVPRPSVADELAAALETHAEQLRPGASLRAFVETVEDAHDLDQRYPAVGGIGLELDEWPTGAAGVDVEPGMAFELTLAVPTAEGGTAFAGDTVLVTDDGIEIVTRP